MNRRSRRKEENNRSLHSVNEDYVLTQQRRDRIYETDSKKNPEPKVRGLSFTLSIIRCRLISLLRVKFDDRVDLDGEWH